ncbi:MAG: ATP-binding protein [Thioalkalivibrionaceae bacterium]
MSTEDVCSKVLDQATQQLLRGLRSGHDGLADRLTAIIEAAGLSLGARALIHAEGRVATRAESAGILRDAEVVSALTWRSRAVWSSVSPALQALMDERAPWSMDSSALEHMPRECLVLWRPIVTPGTNEVADGSVDCSEHDDLRALRDLGEPFSGANSGVSEWRDVDDDRAADRGQGGWAEQAVSEPVHSGGANLSAPDGDLARVLRLRRCSGAIAYQVPMDGDSAPGGTGDFGVGGMSAHSGADSAVADDDRLPMLNVLIWEFAEVAPIVALWREARAALKRFNETLVATLRVMRFESLHRRLSRELGTAMSLSGVSRWAWEPGRNVFRFEGPFFFAAGLGYAGERVGLGDFLAAFAPQVRPELQRRLMRPALRALTRSGPLERALPWLGAEGGEHGRTRGWVLLRMQDKIADNAGRGEEVIGTLVDITAVKERERVARLERKQLDQIVGQAPIALFSQSLDGDVVRYHYISASGERLFGMAATSMSCAGVFHERVHPADWPVLRARSHSLRKRGIFSAEYRVRVPARGWCWVQEESSCLERRDDSGAMEVVGVWLDISDRKEAEMRQRATEDLYRDVVENAPAMIAVLYADFSLRFFNSMFSSYFSGALESLGARRFLDFLCDSDREKFRREAESCSMDEPCRSLEVRLLSPGKEIRWVHWSIRAFRDVHGRVEEYQIVGRDNTELRDAQNQLFHAARLSEIGELAVGIGHEINQPLNVIRLATTNALATLRAAMPVDQGRIQGKFERIADQVDRISKIIELLRSYGRRSERSDQTFAPAVAIEGALLLVGERLRQAAVRIERQIEAGDVRIRGSVVQLEQVLVNLLTNAIDAIETCRSKSGDLPREAVITLRSQVTPTGAWVLEVVDQGGGVPAWVLPRIFEAFFTTKESGQGTGLGLSVSRDLVLRMRGELTVRNEGDGACFTVTLPMASDDTSADSDGASDGGERDAGDRSVRLAMHASVSAALPLME